MILGSNGSIGKALTKRLINHGYELYRFKRGEYTQERTFSFQDLLKDPPIVDIVINCLTKYVYTTKSDEEIYYSNYELPIILINRLVETNPNLWIYNLHTDLEKELNSYSNAKHRLNKYLHSSYENYISFKLPLIVGNSAPKGGLFFDLNAARQESFNPKTPNLIRNFLTLDDFLEKIIFYLKSDNQLKHTESFNDVLYSIKIETLIKQWYEKECFEDKKFTKEILRIKSLFSKKTGGAA